MLVHVAVALHTAYSIPQSSSVGSYTQENERACCVVCVQCFSNQTWRTESMWHTWLDIAILCNSMLFKFQGAWAGFRHIPRELLGALRAGPWLCCIANIEIMRFPKSLTSTPARDWHEHSLSLKMYVKVTLGECGNVAFQHLRVPMLSKYRLQAQGKKTILPFLIQILYSVTAA